jgi:hypothetical protein
MTGHPYFEAICACGNVNHIQEQGRAFACQCGRKSIIDFSIGYSERELIQILNNLDAQRDHVAKVIECRRQRTAA